MASRSVAVIAVDPSSPITGGALLGDRVRMQAYAEDPDVFIRSMAARGHAGGLASTSSAAAAVLDAVGFDLVLVETVGTGQSEVEVAAAADTTVVLEAPEMGDEVQAIKAGLLEVADIVVVNKADRPGAQRTAAQLRAMLVAAPAAGGGRRRGRRPAPPKRPEVLSRPRPPARACPELLAALDARRPAAPTTRPAPPAAVPAPRPRSGRSSATGSAARLLSTADGEGTRGILDDVADHRLDPFAAADRARRAALERHGVTVEATRPRLLTPAIRRARRRLARVLHGRRPRPAGRAAVREVRARGRRDRGRDRDRAFSVAALLLRPLVGWSSDRFGRRPLLLGGALLTVVGAALHLVATRSRRVHRGARHARCGRGFFFVASLAAASDIAPEARRGEAISFLTLSLYLGLAIGPPIAEGPARGGLVPGGLAGGRRRRRGRGRADLFVPESAPGDAQRRGRRAAAAEPAHPPGRHLPGDRDPARLFGMAGFLRSCRSTRRPSG